MARIAPLDFEDFARRRQAGRAGAADGDDEHGYAYVSDRTTRAAFARIKPVELAVAATVRAWNAVEKNRLLGQSVRVGPTQFPRVWDITRHASDALGITPPTVYVVNQQTLNAMTAGTLEDSFILVHSALVDHLNDDELLDVIGHECGHVHNQHVVYLTTLHMLQRLSSMFLDWIVLPAVLALSAWSRRAEITCDRAGLLCCKSLDVSTKSLAKLALGSQRLFDQLDLDAFVAQYDEGQRGAGRYLEAFASHPWVPKRVVALRAFAESRLYRRRAGLGDDGLSMSEVDEKVHEIIKVV